ncbi:protein kinase [Streptomyces sp. NPDC056492]|uniref:protein kinase domain-containing protein n=1 Tax=unclassified Streptomyces TaxID=2593676 RepID=UPI00368675A5
MEPLGPGDPIRLGPYRVVGILGEGGMGKVYLGRDGAGRPAAVKVLLPELADDQNLARRFLREAQTARSVTGGGVARVLDAQSEGNRPWIATEFLSGPTLDEAVRRYGPLGGDTVRALTASLAATLREIHAAGLVHRDLKPANIVLTSGGPRVIDFGIARPEHGLTLTTTGQIPVTPGYGAPEQVLGRRVGPAADVFSLGALLAYAATGQRAFDGTHVAAVQYEVVHGEPQLASVPADLRHLIEPCLAKDPAHRPTPEQIEAASAPPRGADRAWRKGPIADDIARRTAEAKRQTAPDGPGPGPGSGAGPSRRRLLRGSLAAGGVLVASGTATGSWWLLRDDTRPLPAAGPARTEQPMSLSAADYGRLPPPLWGPLPVAAQALDGVVTPPLPLVDVVVFAAKGGGLAARTAHDGKEKWRLPDVSPKAGLLALPDQGFVAAGSDGALLRFDASTSRRSWKVAGADTGRILAADESAVYVLTRDRQLRAVDTLGRTVRWTVRLAQGAVQGAGPLAAAGSGRLVVSGADGNVNVLDTATGDMVWWVNGQAKSAVAPLVDKDTAYLGGRNLTARDLADGKVKWKADEAEHGALPATAGWGPPVPYGDYVIGVHGSVLSWARTGTGLPWSKVRGGKGSLPNTPPVVQSRTVWAVEAGGHGVSAYSAEHGALYWTLAPESQGPWGVSGAGNRVFLVNDGKLTAMPSVD